MAELVHWPECTNDPCTCGERGDLLWRGSNLRLYVDQPSIGIPVPENIERDPAEDACYEIQKACWSFQTAIERAETGGRIAFIAGMLEESRKRLGLVCTYAAAKELELKR